MKRPLVLAEMLRNAPAYALAGSIALMGAGCTFDSSSPDVHATPRTYAAIEGADDLPKLEREKAAFREPSDRYTIDAYTLARGIDSDAYESHINPGGDSLPSGISAPLLDIMINSEGELVYKNHAKHLSAEQRELLGTVFAASIPLQTALQSGAARQVHFRLFKPNQFPGHPEWEPQAEPLFIPRDNNDEGQPAIYYYFAAGSRTETSTVAMELSHESAHVLLKHDYAAPASPEETKALAAACTTIRDSALELVHQDGQALLNSLAILRSLSPAEYAPSYRIVSQAIETGTYGSLPVDPKGMVGVPQCFLEDPWGALIYAIRTNHLANGPLPQSLFTASFEREVNELVENWHDLVKEHAVYRALSESTYLAQTKENRKAGHGHENGLELSASTANLALLEVPHEMGALVAHLPADQKQAVLTVVDHNYQILNQMYADFPEFQTLIDANYETFLAAVG